MGGVAGGVLYAGSILKFDAGQNGIIIERYSTSGDGVSRGDWTVIKDLAIQAAGKTSTAHGLVMNARARAENCWITGFAGNGAHLVATTPTNCNGWALSWCRIDNNGGHGVFTDGTDANAGTAIGVDCSGNGGWGFYDSSDLGNTYIGCHTDTNVGGGYKTEGSVNQSNFYGCYTEGSQNPNEIMRPSLWFGRYEGNGFAASSTAPILQAYSSRAWMVRNALVARNERTANIIESSVGEDDNSQTAFSMKFWSGASLIDDWRWHYQLSNSGPTIGWWELVRNGLTAQTAMRVSGANAPQGPGYVWFPNGYLFGEGALVRSHFQGTAPPVGGTWTAGDTVRNATPTDGGNAEWVYTTAGQWRPVGVPNFLASANAWTAQQSFNAGTLIPGGQRARWTGLDASPPLGARRMRAHAPFCGRTTR